MGVFPCSKKSHQIKTQKEHMFRAYALTMTRPQERFGLTPSMSRELARHPYLGWYVVLWVLILAFGFTYVSFMITASAKGFQLRDVESRLERLRTESRALETQVASLSSIQQMTDRARAMGFVNVDRVASVSAASHSYALAR